LNHDTWKKKLKIYFELIQEKSTWNFLYFLRFYRYTCQYLTSINCNSFLDLSVITLYQLCRFSVLFSLFLAYSSIIYMRLEKKLKERKLSDVFLCKSIKTFKEVFFFHRRIVFFREQHAIAIATVAYCCIRIHVNLYFT